MNSWGLVVHDEQTFLNKVVNAGMEQGIFTRDRADEIIRISVAMANKYVLQKEIDFRSEEELTKVQETILKLIGVGLEIKCQGDLDEGIRLIMESSPVALFRLAYTRVEKLRNRWARLLLNHRVEILVSSQEFECLNDFVCQKLAEMSVFRESELYGIRAITLADELFSTLSTVEYYESEADKYEFILSLKDILPFKLLNRSPNVRAENLAELDSIRDALTNTLWISAHMDSPDPVSVSTQHLRDFVVKLQELDFNDLFPPDMEDVLLEVIQELGEGLDERQGALLAREVVQSAQEFLDTVSREWETVSSASDDVFFKRWSRLVIISDAPDPLDRVLKIDGVLDEFEFEVLLDQLVARSDAEVARLVSKLPWDSFTSGQVMSLFHRLQSHQRSLAEHVSLEGFNCIEMLDLIEGVNPDAMKAIGKALKKTMIHRSFSLEDLELLDSIPNVDTAKLLLAANPPADYDTKRVLNEYREGSEKLRRVLFYSCWGSEFFPELFAEAWAIDSATVRKLARAFGSQDIGPFLLSASGNHRPALVERQGEYLDLEFEPWSVNALFRSLPKGKKLAAMKFFSKHAMNLR